MANPNPSPGNQFQKGHPKIGNAGRKPGPNPFQKLLHDAVLEAAEQVGEVKVVEKTDKNGRVCRTTYEWNGKDALVGYLRFLAVYHPPTFAGLLGRVMPLHANVKTDTQVKVSHPPLAKHCASTALTQRLLKRHAARSSWSIVRMSDAWLDHQQRHWASAPMLT
jgi:hypothetical protein